MFINEMASGSLVSIGVRNKEGKEVVLDTQIVGAYEAGDYKMVLVDALRHNGQLLVFNSVICEALVSNADDNRLYRFKLQGIVKRESEGTIYHCLISSDNATEENRRGAKRFGVGEKATIQLLGAGNTLRGHVLDISATGVAFSVSGSELAVGDKVGISFMHEITGIQIKVTAQIVRQEERDKGMKYGCALHKHDSKYNMLLAYLMRQECKVRQ